VAADLFSLQLVVDIACDHAAHSICKAIEEIASFALQLIKQHKFAAEPFRLLDLPTEIKHMIYDQWLLETVENDKDRKEPSLEQLSGTSNGVSTWDCFYSNMDEETEEEVDADMTGVDWSGLLSTFHVRFETLIMRAPVRSRRGP
jgi:hypothetical protein